MTYRRILSWAAQAVLLTAVAGQIVSRGVEPLPDKPLVSVLATDPRASESGPSSGAFTIFRTGPTDAPLRVFYGLGGHAENGVDYQKLETSVEIPAQAAFVPIVVMPIDDPIVEGDETVELTLQLPPTANPLPPPYQIAWPAQAVVHISDNDGLTNPPPVVRLVSPPQKAFFSAGDDVPLVAHAWDFQGVVNSVEFFAGDLSLGVVANPPPPPTPGPLSASAVSPQLFPDFPAPTLPVPPYQSFQLTWTNPPPGQYVLTAVATDDGGAKTKSEPVHITVTDGPGQPVVTVIATDPVAAETDPTLGFVNTATFSIHRSGDTSLPLTVNFSLAGTAQNGVDYDAVATEVTIPSGAATADVVIKPIDDALVEGTESVVLTLELPVCPAIFPPPPGCYLVGHNHRAEAIIRDNDQRNQPPHVRLVRPFNGAAYAVPATITLVAEASDADGSVRKVEFFEGDQSLGIVTNPPPALTPASLAVPARPPFHLTWTNVPAGSYVLTAKATDDLGAYTISTPVELKVVEVKLLPVVTVTTTDGEAAEQSPLIDAVPNTAILTLHRTGSTDQPLNVNYHMEGDALNGVDYQKLSGLATIPAGAATTDIVISAIDDDLVEGTESVVLALDGPGALHPASPPPGDYLVGEPRRAKAVILDNEVGGGNVPPVVEIVHPFAGSVFLAPAHVELAARAKDADGKVVTVEFFAGDHSLGSVTNPPALTPVFDNLFQLVWPDAPAGEYALTAVATDDLGAKTTSVPIKIKIIEAVHPPLVTITAEHPDTSEVDPLTLLPISPAIFVVHRTGSTDEHLAVRYQVGGSAENGVDYDKLPGELVIPAGETSARILINPIDDTLVEGTEKVVVMLLPALCPPSVPPVSACYLVGVPGYAVAYIRDNDVGPNQPPRLAITHPHSGEVFADGADLKLVVEVRDVDGSVSKVEFFANGDKLGEQVINFIVAPPPGEHQVFSLPWAKVSAGAYVLTAVATDDQGAAAKSDPVTINVLATNHPPVVTILAIDPFASEHGTNTATFRIRRTGDTNAPLTVQYAIGGTATNGVDYATISDSVTIPAGRHSARVVITPINDPLVEHTETVVLKLVPPVDPLTTSDAPSYVVGYPAKAIAVIADDDHPEHPVTDLGEGMHVRANGTNGFPFRVEASTDLRDWTPATSGVVTDGAVHFVDPDSGKFGFRFYRVVPELAPQPQDD